MDVVVIGSIIVVGIIAFALGTFIGSRRQSGAATDQPLPADRTPSAEEGPSVIATPLSEGAVEQAITPDDPGADVQYHDQAVDAQSTEACSTGVVDEPSVVFERASLIDLDGQPDVDTTIVEEPVAVPGFLAEVDRADVTVQLSDDPDTSEASFSPTAPVKADLDDDLLHESLTSEEAAAVLDVEPLFVEESKPDKIADPTKVDESHIDELIVVPFDREHPDDEIADDEQAPDDLITERVADCPSQACDTSTDNGVNADPDDAVVEEIRLDAPSDFHEKTCLPVPSGLRFLSWPEGYDPDKPLIAVLGPGLLDLPEWLVENQPRGVTIGPQTSIPREATVVRERTDAGQRNTLRHPPIEQDGGKSRYDMNTSVRAPSRWLSPEDRWFERERLEGDPFRNVDKIAAESDLESLLRSDWEPVYIDAPDPYWGDMWLQDRKFIEDDDL